MTTEATKERLTREQIILRTTQEFQEGWLVNLGSGLPSYCANYVPPERGVTFHAENGIVGMGKMATAEEVDLHLVNALGQHVLLQPWAAIVDHADSFALVRSGRLDVTVLGAYEVAENGDFANVSREPGKPGAGGGAMDMAANAKRVFVVMQHTTDDGRPRLVKGCTLPLTAPGVVKKVFTDLGVFEVTPGGFVIKEIAPGWTVEEVQALSEATIHTALDLKEVEI